MTDLKLYRGNEMTESKPVEWLLTPGYLKPGVNLLVGDEGIGKSLWTIQAIAALTSGKPWGPFTIAAEPADVLLIATEDGWQDTVRPRLEVAGADLSRVCMLCEGKDGEGHPILPYDMDALSDLAISPALVVVDAWVDTVAAGVSLEKAQKTREALRPWKSYAEKTGAAVLLVTHTNRQSAGKARDNYGLSGALRQAVRSSLYATEENGELLVGPEKSNAAGESQAQRFAITPVQHFTPTEASDGTVPLLQHVGADDRTMQQVVAQQQQATPRQETSRNSDVDGWLTDLLSGGPVKSATVSEQGKARGYGQDQIDRSRKRIGAETVKDGAVWVTKFPHASTPQQGRTRGDAELRSCGVDLEPPYDSDYDEVPPEYGYEDDDDGDNAPTDYHYGTDCDTQSIENLKWDNIVESLRKDGGLK